MAFREFSTGELTDNFEKTVKKIEFSVGYYYNVEKGLNVRDKEWRRYR